MDTAEIRRRFLSHFESRDHTIVASASLLLDDPNLLFVNAGMVPFVPYFLGQEQAPYKRAVSVQKCVRTLDIEEVGKTDRHGTFFQMNGNFSFGDYFKEGAIDYAWDLVTRSQDDGGYGIEEDRLHVSVYFDDDEAVGLWKRIAGLSDERIHRLGKADNYWSMGVPGPCGPDSELHFDRGPAYGPDGDISKAGDRYIEFWNLVFMQSIRGAGIGKDDFEIVDDLPEKNIDTGMGLERMAMLLQGVDSIYEIDEVHPVLAKAGALAGRTYGADHDADVRMRVVADHVRSGLMLIADGVTPGNEQRGYVLRRILRRVVRSMRLLGVEDTTFPELLPVSYEQMRKSYPELDAEWARISQVAYAEEEAFRHTLKAGTVMFDLAASATKQQGGAELSGAKAFQLHDTFGFPIDLTLEMAAEQGLLVDEVGFRDLMGQQRARAQADSRTKKGQHTDASAYREIFDQMGGAVTFTGTTRWRPTRASRDSSPRRGQLAQSPRARPARLSSTAHRSTPRVVGSSPTRESSHCPTACGCWCSTCSPRPAASSCTRRRCSTGRWSSVSMRTRSSTSSGGAPSVAPTPRHTWCTKRSAKRSARPPPRPAVRTHPVGSGSTSPQPRQCRRPCFATSKPGSTTSCSPTSVSRRS